MQLTDFVSFADWLDQLPTLTREQKLMAYFRFLNGDAAPVPQPFQATDEQVWTAPATVPPNGNGKH